MRVAVVVLVTASTAFLACRPSQGAPSAASAPPDVFDEYMKVDAPPADGFDFPVGDPDGRGDYVDAVTRKTYRGWYVATSFGEKYALGIHPAEDWNGVGGGDTDLGQDVRAVAAGRVVVSEQLGQPWGNVVVIEHVFYENNQKLRVRSLYAHLLERSVRAGDLVTRRQRVGAIGKDPKATFAAHLHLELRRDLTLGPTYWPSDDGKDQAWVREHYAPPSEFIRAHRKLLMPQNEPALALVDAVTRKLRLYTRGRARGTYDVSFGQAAGQKQLQGDLKTPRGMYFVVDRHRGAVPGEFGAYYGGFWIKLNYP
ncbi:MAG: peptidoglycan DD-metalloendopeptidase family protein, partial [Polyangiales bacterium]